MIPDYNDWEDEQNIPRSKWAEILVGIILGCTAAAALVTVATFVAMTVIPH